VDLVLVEKTSYLESFNLHLADKR